MSHPSFRRLAVLLFHSPSLVASDFSSLCTCAEEAAIFSACLSLAIARRSAISSCVRGLQWTMLFNEPHYTLHKQSTSTSRPRSADSLDGGATDVPVLGPVEVINCIYFLFYWLADSNIFTDWKSDHYEPRYGYFCTEKNNLKALT